MSLFANLAFLLMVVKATISFAVVALFFIRLFQGRVTLKWLRERRWWF